MKLISLLETTLEEQRVTEHVADYSDAHNYQGHGVFKGDPYESELWATLTKANRMIGKLLQYLDSGDVQYYLKKENEYRNLVDNVIELSKSNKSTE